jgi:hypothetical protein
MTSSDRTADLKAGLRKFKADIFKGFLLFLLVQTVLITILVKLL